jgi:hypothetical protein
MTDEKLKEEILAKIEIDKIEAESTAKEIASKHLGKHATMAMIGILQHIVGAVEKEEKPELEIIKSLIKELSNKEDDPMQVDVTDTDVTVTKGESKVTASKKK